MLIVLLHHQCVRCHHRSAERAHKRACRTPKEQRFPSAARHSQRSERDPQPSCRTAARLIRILGRTEEVTKVRGMFVHPGQIDEVVARFPEVKRYQVVVTRTGNDDDMLVRLGTHAREASYGMDQALLDALRAATKLRVRLKYVPDGTIPEGAKKSLDQRTWT